jgi:hypothetical protein
VRHDYARTPLRQTVCQTPKNGSRINAQNLRFPADRTFAFGFVIWTGTSFGRCVEDGVVTSLWCQRFGVRPSLVCVCLALLFGLGGSQFWVVAARRGGCVGVGWLLAGCLFGVAVSAVGVPVCPLLWVAASGPALRGMAFGGLLSAVLSVGGGLRARVCGGGRSLGERSTSRPWVCCGAAILGRAEAVAAPIFTASGMTLAGSGFANSPYLQGNSVSGT